MKSYEKAYKDRKAGKSYREIAEKYNVSINTVKSWKIKQWKRLEEEEAHKKEEKAHKEAHTFTYEKAAETIKQGKESFVEEKTKKTGRNAVADSQNIKEVQKLAEYKKAHRPPAFGVRDTGKMIKLIADYFNRCDESEQPYTRAGLIRALDVSPSTYKRYRDGELDYLLEEHILINHIDLDTCSEIVIDDFGNTVKIDIEGNPLISFSCIIQKALLRLEEQAEQRLYTKARVGDIFTLKQYGWTDEKSTVSTTNNNLIIADKEEAEKALSLLYGV